jgi:hypothetical protein
MQQATVHPPSNGRLQWLASDITVPVRKGITDCPNGHDNILSPLSSHGQSALDLVGTLYHHIGARAANH